MVVKYYKVVLQATPAVCVMRECYRSGKAQRHAWARDWAWMILWVQPWPRPSVVPWPQAQPCLALPCLAERPRASTEAEPLPLALRQQAQQERVQGQQLGQATVLGPAA